MRYFACATTFLVLAVLLTAGCDKKRAEPVRARISGKVTYDGKTLATGKVTFDPQDGTPPAVFDILDGKFEGMATIGKNKVMITSFVKYTIKEKYGKDGPGYDTPTEENILPARYGLESQITREVVADGPNEFNFDLKPK